MADDRLRFERIALDQLHNSWHHCLAQFVWDGMLQAPVLKLHDAKDPLAYWRTERREMSFSRHLVFERSWHETLEVLKHEMAHQFVDEHLGIRDERPHGKTFQAVCHRHNIDAAPRGIPGAESTSSPNHIVEKIRHLLDLAHNNASEAEAKLAAETAHALMLKYNIDLQAARTAQHYVVRHLGRPTGKIERFVAELANMLERFYFVEIIWMPGFNTRTGRHGHELEVCGTAENVDVAEYVYEFLTRAAVDAWERAKRGRHLTRGGAINARFNFLTGFVEGFVSQLRTAQDKENAEGLVLARDPALAEFFKTRHPRIVNIGGGGTGRTNADWRSSGQAQGRNVHLPAAARSMGKTTLLLTQGS